MRKRRRPPRPAVAFSNSNAMSPHRRRRARTLIYIKMLHGLAGRNAPAHLQTVRRRDPPLLAAEVFNQDPMLERTEPGTCPPLPRQAQMRRLRFINESH